MPPTGDTIAAISTPAGEGALAIVRMSGPEAVSVADHVFRGSEKPSRIETHRQHYGHIRDEDDTAIDEVMLVIHRAPHSYTGEDVVEISCHGGVLVTARILQRCLSSGARAARPGEFTERAFLNGKMDLTQAEAVMDLIRAQTDLALRSAVQQLDGQLGTLIRALRDDLVSLLAHMEASVDFPDEDIAPDNDARLGERLEELIRRIAQLIETAPRGRIFREGVRVVIAGPTNAGKSSLLNQLLGYDRAIVSEIAGTTRDTIEEVINLQGVPVRLLDTAGFRETSDPLEQAGLARTGRSLEGADIVLRIVDASDAPRDTHPLVSGDRPELLLLNKCDLPEHPGWRGVEGLRISCLNGTGLDALGAAILTAIGERHLSAESTVAINVRHADLLRRAHEACGRAAETLRSGLSLEYAAPEIRVAIGAVEEVAGSAGDDALLDSVFSQFCIGK